MIYKRLRLTLIVTALTFEIFPMQGTLGSTEMDEASLINYKLVKNTSKSPWSMIGQITTIFKDGKTAHGSCTLINEDCVLTAASNISPKHMGPQKSLPIRTDVFLQILMGPS